MSKPLPDDLPLRATRPLLPDGAVRAARAASAGTATDFRSLLASGLAESRLDPHAHNRRSSATGAFQFTERTWLDLVRRHGAELGRGDLAKAVAAGPHGPAVADAPTRQAILALRSDTPFAAALAARYFDENRASLMHSLHRRPSENEVRMAFLLGASGAARLIKAARDHPGLAADRIVPAAVHSNPGLFREHGGRVKTAQAAVTALNHHFTAVQRRVDAAVAHKVSALDPGSLPAGAAAADLVPVDEG